MELFLQLLFIGLFVLVVVALSGVVLLGRRGELGRRAVPSVVVTLVMAAFLVGFAYWPDFQSWVAMEGWLVSLLGLMGVVFQAWFFPLVGGGAARRLRVSLKVLTFLVFFIVLCVGASVR